MVELIIRHTGKLFHFINGQTAEITHLMAKKNIVLFISCFLGSMGSEYKALFYFIKFPTEFIVQIKCGGEPMRLIQMIQLRIKTKQINKLCSSHSQQNKLRELGRYIGII